MFNEFLQDHRLADLITCDYAPCPLRQDRCSWEGLSPKIKAQLIRQGDLAKEGYPMLSAASYLAYVRCGDRNVYEEPYFMRRRKLLYAVLAECVQNKGNYLDAVIDGIWCICEESSWAVSAHNGSSHPGSRPIAEHPLPDVQNPYIDLFAAQTAATLCHTLRLLQDSLDAVSPLICRRVRLELERRIFLPFMTRDDFWWMGMTQHHINNWNPWILSNVMECIALEMHDRPRQIEGLARAMRMLDRYLDMIPADGGCDEGPGYWNVAGASLLDCLELLYMMSEGRISFYHVPLIRAIGSFPATAYIQDGYFWNFADCATKPMLDGERLYCFGSRTSNDALMALGRSIFDLSQAASLPDTPQCNRLLFSLFANIPENPKSLSPKPESFLSLPILQVFAWNQNGIYAAIKAGHNDESHNHNDVGSFLLYVDGEPQIVDAGSMTYTAKTFSDQRYTLWNTRSCNHNIPLIDGKEQSPGRQFSAHSVHADENGATMELQAAYPSDCGLKTFTRSFYKQSSGFCLTDTLTFFEPKVVEWVFLLRFEPHRVGNQIHFGKVCMSIPSYCFVAWKEVTVTDKRMAQSFPGSLWRVTLTMSAKSEYQESFSFTRRTV